MDFQETPIIATPIEGGFKVALRGAIHTNNAWIERELEKVAAAKPKHVELDLAQCPFISSSGIGTLIAFHNRIKAADGSIEIVAIQKPVLGTLRFARLETLFKVAPQALVAAKT